MERAPIRTVGVLGGGAVGAAIASMIMAKVPEAVSILAEGERAEKYRKNGFLVNGTSYHIPIVDGKTATPVDLLIVATKSYDLETAIGQAAAAVGRNTAIISLLNGISSEQIIASRFGAEHVLPAMIVGIDSVRENGKIQYSNRGVIHFGLNPDANAAQQEPVVEAVKLFLGRCEIPAIVAEDIRRALWWKFMVNVGINQPSAILHAPYGVFQLNNEARELMRAAMREVVVISQKMGVGLDEHDIADWEKTLATLSPAGKTSMLQDTEARRRTEVDLFAGTVVALGAQYGVEVPVNRTFYQMLRTIESMRTQP